MMTIYYLLQMAASLASQQHYSQTPNAHRGETRIREREIDVKIQVREKGVNIVLQC